MTSINSWLAVGGVLAGALLLGLASRLPGQDRRRAPLLVDLEVRVGDSCQGKVVWAGAGFDAVQTGKGRKPNYYHNARISNFGIKVSGQSMGWDLEGKSKLVLALRLDRHPNARWDMVHTRGEMTVRMRVPAGPLKGWWVGLGPAVEDKDGLEVRRPLVLLEDKKDAVKFVMEDADDVSP